MDWRFSFLILTREGQTDQENVKVPGAWLCTHGLQSPWTLGWAAFALTPHSRSSPSPLESQFSWFFFLPLPLKHQFFCSSSVTNLFSKTSPTPMTSVITYMLLSFKSEPLSRALSLNTATEFSSQTGNTVSNSWPVPSPVPPILINESIDTLKSPKPAI